MREKHVCRPCEPSHEILLSSGHHGPVVGVLRQEGLLEFEEGEAVVSTFVVASKEKLDLVLVWEDADMVETKHQVV